MFPFSCVAAWETIIWYISINEKLFCFFFEKSSLKKKTVFEGQILPNWGFQKLFFRNDLHAFASSLYFSPMFEFLKKKTCLLV